MTYLIFNTLAEAERADKQTSENMNLTGDVTTNWDVPQKTADGKFVITKPEERFMTNITDFQEVPIYSRFEINEES